MPTSGPGGGFWNDYTNDSPMRSDLSGTVDNIAAGSTATLISYTVLSNEYFILMGFRGSGDGNGLYELLVGGIVKAAYRTESTNMQAEVYSQVGKRIAAGTVILLRVKNYSDVPIKFEGEIYAR